MTKLENNELRCRVRKMTNLVWSVFLQLLVLFKLLKLLQFLVLLELLRLLLLESLQFLVFLELLVVPAFLFCCSRAPSFSGSSYFSSCRLSHVSRLWVMRAYKRGNTRYSYFISSISAVKRGPSRSRDNRILSVFPLKQHQLTCDWSRARSIHTPPSLFLNFGI